MLDQDDRRAAVAQARDEPHHRVDLGTDKAAGDLVEQQELRAQRQGARDFETLQIEQRQRSRRRMLAIEQAAIRQGVADIGFALAIVADRAVGADFEILPHGHAAERPRDLARAADAETRRTINRQAIDAMAQKLHLARCGRQRAGHQREERRFACAVRPDHAERLLRREIERHFGERRDAAIVLADPAQRQDRAVGA